MTDIGKTAFITGVTGQDGSILAKQLLEKGYTVVGMKRRTSLINTDRLDEDSDVFFHPNFKLEYGNMTDSSCLYRLLQKYQPNEIYNLAAQSHVRVSFEVPEETLDVVAGGTLKLLEAYRQIVPHARFYQASSSEMYGDNPEAPQNEETKMMPASPYACAKLYAHNLCRNYREAYGLHISCGILFNHESPVRGETFVTRKITMAAARIKLGKQEILKLGNLDAKRDWGLADDYCINKDVPILTPSGWKYFDEISPGDEIINFDPQKNTLSRDIVLKVVEPKVQTSRKIRLTGRSIDLTCTPNHRIYYQQKSKISKGGWSDWKVATAQEMHEKFSSLSLRTKYDYRFPHFQDYSGEELAIITDDQIYLVGALLAEGHLRTSHKPSSGHRVTVSQSHIANPKIHSKLNEIFIKLGFSPSTRINNSGVTEWCFNAEDSEKILSWFDTNDLHVMPSWAYSLSSRQARILFDSMMDCDGHWGSLTYTSKRTLLLVDFQSIAALAGFQTTKPRQVKSGCWVVTAIAKRKKYSYVTNIEEIDDGITDVWCVSTNNGTIVSRDNGSITISGNCHAMWLMLQQPEPDDYVIATGETHTVREFLEETFSLAGLNVEKHLMIDERLFRPHEVPLLLGDATKAKEKLGWTPTVTFKELVKIMYEEDFDRELNM